MASVEFRHIHKTYPDGTHALEDLNLQVADGEMMVLVGPSGCGKSTALRLLAGLDSATNGDLLIDSKRVNEHSPQDRDIAMVFQNYSLYPHMTVRRNLEFPLRMLKLSAPERAKRVEETARLLDLSRFLERKPRQLSGGQRQRVAMGRAMVRQPQVFLMDEPLSNLDAKLRIQIRAEIADLQKRLGITTIFVTHDQVEAMTLGDRIAVLNGGRLQQVGRPQELYDQPANVFVAAFLGNPGMNIFSARLNREISTMDLANGGWEVRMESLLEHNPWLKYYQRGSLLAGLRPEAFSTKSALAADVMIKAVESLGHERLVYFTPLNESVIENRETLVARLPGPQQEKAGEITQLGFDPSQLYLFQLGGDAII
jgi:multiple sugar transport system ATP-binding protein